KFASDFSEKYRVKPIKLTENAKAILLQYGFPGNIRQLKNLVEQISVLELEREINEITLLKYLPQDKITSTAMSYAGKGDADFSERDILYQVLFDLKKDMNELKKLVFEMFKSGKVNEQIINDHKDLFQNIGADFPASSYNSTKLLEQNNVKTSLPTTIEINKIEEIQEHEVESLSIEDKEKELILKALKKNNQKRKYAAQDLGISERTLYRKIKQYDIEEN
ncbi:MAG: hypothetical protein RL711_1336, partial [Bacteroidota bacterium]